MIYRNKDRLKQLLIYTCGKGCQFTSAVNLLWITHAKFNAKVSILFMVVGRLGIMACVRFGSASATPWELPGGYTSERSETTERFGENCPKGPARCMHLVLMLREHWPATSRDLRIPGSLLVGGLLINKMRWQVTKIFSHALGTSAGSRHADRKRHRYSHVEG